MHLDNVNTTLYDFNVQNYCHDNCNLSILPILQEDIKRLKAIIFACYNCANSQVTNIKVFATIGIP